MISAGNRPGTKESVLETSAGDAYYNNPNVSERKREKIEFLLIFLLIIKGARIMHASHFESEYILGRKLSFYCKAQGIPRPRITWLKDGIELYEHPFFQVTDIFLFIQL